MFDDSKAGQQGTGHSFYEAGLRFSCTRCSKCCRHESGYVFLSASDAKALCACLKMEYEQFVNTSCRWIPDGDEEKLSLREKPGYDCIFWNGGCTVYNARPLQCRSFPFWEFLLKSADNWVMAATDCPGMSTGALHTQEEIASILHLQRKNAILSRPAFLGRQGSVV
ncbi:YkgJ family cysteine cluster protein [Breznakiellaceae bacterium SP9]